MEEELKKCTNPKCQQPLKPRSAFSPRKTSRDGLHSWCRRCNTIASNAWRVAHLDAYRAGRNEHGRLYNIANKLAACNAYGGPRCSCPGCYEERIEFLCIDHANGGGNAHRREIKSVGGGSFYLWLKKRNYPLGYRVLCHNCNHAISHYSHCPHEMWQAQDYSI